MNNKPILYGIIGLLIGVGITAYVSKAPVITQQGSMSMGSSMDQMMGSMMGKNEDDFDQAFMRAMIVHHEGAIQMAKAAQTQAKHEELKKLADDIIVAQTKEIQMMQLWQTQWGY